MKILVVFVILVVTELALSQKVVYPLDVGDRWEYWWGWNAYHDQTTVLRDTLMPDGYGYALLQDNRYYLKRFEHQVGDSVFEFSPVVSGGRLIYDFTRAPGDTLYSIIDALDTIDLIASRQGTVNFLGRNLRQWVFDYVYRHTLDAGESFEVTDSLGLTARSDLWTSIHLRGAIINGIKYGEITHLHQKPDEAPSAFTLHQNYPNPFNPRTTISYELPGRSFVTLKVFNIFGQEVATLANGIKDASVKVVDFAARDLSSGVYFYRITAANGNRSFIRTQKAILLK